MSTTGPRSGTGQLGLARGWLIASHGAAAATCLLAERMSGDHDASMRPDLIEASDVDHKQLSSRWGTQSATGAIDDAETYSM
ncbi:hypothetical protein L226DRAFT_372479 [Lentinus tigrinus ALCF2SS1-7]|uniref:uncharacterized protein n=1 Tax=Lentinus tigrinus ALCF2SS1-7 TaxID=1328758 RepID=UPI001165FE8F|nr:hypothetical protein L226DRAFT_372479 [Lentinus tigrinus ALCF2SS1-7]